ncbi:hypothetical protein ACS0TY_005223 [Phlomoides rotata]
MREICGLSLLLSHCAHAFFFRFCPSVAVVTPTRLLPLIDFQNKIILFQTMFMRDAFVLDFTTEETNVVLSYGPCQFPTLGFVVERFWEIQSHEPEELWTINCTHNSKEGTATFNWMNYPMLMATWKVAPALAVGCTKILKPSELASVTCLEFGEVCRGWVSPLPVTLELGGKSPIVVFEDVDLDKAAEWTMFGCLWTNGQICSATSRLLVHHLVAAENQRGVVGNLRRRRCVLIPFHAKSNVVVVPVLGITWDKMGFCLVLNAYEVELIFNAPLEMFLKSC